MYEQGKSWTVIRKCMNISKTEISVSLLICIFYIKGRGIILHIMSVPNDDFIKHRNV